MSDWTYQIPSEPHARGAQGSVYLATRSDGLRVAIKVAAPRKSAARSLRSEAAMLRAAGEVEGVVRCLDLIEVQGHPAMVMPFYPDHLGNWLHRTIEQPDASSLATILERCAELAAILGQVHRCQHEGGTMVHRDVKPENVFVDEEGRLHLGDFGAAMAIDGLRELELALYGTPLWAPLDQVLPGRAMADPTWDTYALCVLLYAALTGARPAYQADPRELLTQQGRILWDLAQRAIQGGPESSELRNAFAQARVGTRATDLVDLTGRAALNQGDRRVLEASIRRLAALAQVSERTEGLLVRGLWGILSRGLSPVSHPSPPNRFRDGLELADLLTDLGALLGDDAEPSVELQNLLTLAPIDQPVLDEPLPMPDPEGRSVFLPVAIGLSVLVVVAALVGVWLWPRLDVEKHAWWGTSQVGQIWLDRAEVTADRWAECVSARKCEPLEVQVGRQPAVGMSAQAAHDFCRWAGGRLPTQAEWLAAAGEAPFPWGDAEPTCAHAAALGCDQGLRPVGERLEGVTPEGLHELAGNAWEWVRTDEGYALMGGSIESPSSELGRKAQWEPPEAPRPPRLAGVRCAYEIRPR